MFCKNFFTIFASISYFSQGKDLPFYFLEHFLIGFVMLQFWWSLFQVSFLSGSSTVQQGMHTVLTGETFFLVPSYPVTILFCKCLLTCTVSWFHLHSIQICSFIMRENLLWATFSYSCSQWVASAFSTSPPLSLELSVLSCTSATDGTLKAKFLDLLHCQKNRGTRPLWDFPKGS